MFKKLLESKFLKGKLTYAGVVIFIAPVIGKLFGVELGEDVITPLIQGFGAIVTIIGRIRAAHQGG